MKKFSIVLLILIGVQQMTNAYHKQIHNGKTIEDLQKEENLKDSKYIRNILNLKYISPDLTEHILNGTQSEILSLQQLINVSNN